ncbi:putative AbiEi antitoxin of type IV toxin-antitoxin system [Solirubrobacter pauli]|uniref:Putative AbiEi antitoxin of type IV toxin-antitoxin system n=1 Tax=Solirubrobacter pauli TaxID=166793 RepID=A0A660L2J3_9ACTN|nr:type IV toxin-antitoxin system AbiEi family antitoxin domain-containing protein [Solirubrobacter pauli]RKQ87149.1 putative AbiEi antitoxin of type IV toxin-antitoxin system [Solirubrobacter pauli]
MPAQSPHRKLAGHTPRQIAARQRDLITYEQLIALGLTRGAISKGAQRGELRRVFRCVYTTAQAPLSREALWLAAVLACGEGAGLSHYAAGTLLDVSRFRSPLIDVVSPRKRTLDGARVHYCRTLDARDITTVKGIPVTRISRLYADFADVLTPFQLANVVHRAAFKGLPTWLPEAPGRHGVATLKKAFDLHAGGSAGTRSTAEDVFLTFALPEPLVNVVHLGFEVDFRWPDRLVAVEIDGPHHGRPWNRNADLHRDQALRQAGYVVLHFSADDVQSRGGYVERAVLDALSVRPGP